VAVGADGVIHPVGRITLLGEEDRGGGREKDRRRKRGR
jgi:hypothetical protein